MTQNDATGTALEQTTLEPTTTHDANDVDRGPYFSKVDETGNEQIIVAPGQPNPAQETSVTSRSSTHPADSPKLSKEALGAIVLDMASESTYQIPNPVIATTFFDEELSQSDTN